MAILYRNGSNSYIFQHIWSTNLKPIPKYKKKSINWKINPKKNFHNLNCLILKILRPQFPCFTNDIMNGWATWSCTENCTISGGIKSGALGYPFQLQLQWVPRELFSLILGTMIFAGNYPLPMAHLYSFLPPKIVQSRWARARGPQNAIILSLLWIEPSGDTTFCAPISTWELGEGQKKNGLGFEDKKWKK